MSAGTEQLQRMMIQADLEAAHEAIGAGQYGAALMTLAGAEEKLKNLAAEGVTQASAARQMGLDSSALNSWLNGKPKGNWRVLLREEGIEPEKMDPSQLEQYLKANKVDMSGPQKRYAAVLKKAKAQQSLERHGLHGMK
jgi:transcriptional regulator with XRE-family HTH domain